MRQKRKRKKSMTTAILMKMLLKTSEKYFMTPALEMSIHSPKEEGECKLGWLVDANKCRQSDFSDWLVTFTSQNKRDFPVGTSPVAANVLWVRQERLLWAATCDLLAMSPLSKGYLSLFWGQKDTGLFLICAHLLWSYSTLNYSTSLFLFLELDALLCMTVLML